MILRKLLAAPIVGAALVAATALGAQAATVNVVGSLAPAQSVEFDVHLPLQNSAQLDQLIALQGNRSSPLYHHYLTPAQFRATYAPSAASVRAAESALVAQGLTITSVQSQLIHVRGTSAQVARALGTQLGISHSASGHLQVAARTRLTVPSVLSQLHATVTGLAATIGPRPLFARAAAPRRNPANRDSPLGLYWFDDLKQAYQEPSNATANGAGVTIATVGLSDFNDADAAAYFAHELVGPGGLVPAPKPKHLSLGGAPFSLSSNDSVEADLDVQQSNGAALGAQVIGVTVGGGNEQFLDAYATLDEDNIADIISTSYGECELYYTAAYNNGIDQSGILAAYHDVFRQGNSQGITFIFSSGDDSGLGCLPLGYFGPATSQVFHPIPGAGIWVDDPNVTAVGGTNLTTTYSSSSLNSAYVNENEVGDRIVTPMDPYGTGNTESLGLWGSGSGTSVLFAKPSYQTLVKTGVSTRAEPDVSMHMGGCPYYGATIVVACDLATRDSADYAIFGGASVGLIGTSASAPEFAGLLAVKESVEHARLGNENQDLYELASANNAFPYHFFHQGIHAYNGVVNVSPGTPGWSPINGVGTPIGVNFVGIPFAAAAGIPQTSSNP